MERLKIGIVGLGPRGRSMIKLASKFEGVEVRAGCDIRAHNWYEKQWRSSRSMAERFPEAAFYESYDRMLEEEQLDAVIVETGADIHADFCIKALEKNINVLSDIPLVANLQEAEDIWKASQRSGAILSVGANPNESRFSVLLKEFYDKSLLGKPYCMEAEYIHWFEPNSAEAKGWSENGDWRKLLSPIRYCTHSLGPLLRILEEELRYVSCFGTGRHTNYISVKKDAMVCAQFRTESGIVVRLMRNGYCRARIGHHSYRVFGTEGYMERIDRFDKPVIRYNSMRELDTSLHEIDGSWMPPAYENNPEATGHGGMDYAMMDHFLDAVRNHKPAPISVKEGLAMTLPGIYAEESAKRDGQVLRMRYPWDEDWTTEM